MVDVDLCSRLAEEGLCSDPQVSARKICELPDCYRVMIFRGKDETQITKMLEKYSQTIKESISAKYGFDCIELKPSSNDNRDHADLYCLSPVSGARIIIEVKFGFYTDKAAGMKQFTEIFGSPIFSNMLSKETRQKWISLIAGEYPNFEKHTHRLINAMNDSIEQFNEHLAAQNYVLTVEQQSYMEEYLLNNSGSYASHSENYMRFETTKNGDRIVEAVPIQKGVGKWKVVPVKTVSESAVKPRISVYVQNQTTGIEIKFILNNKNNYKSKSDGTKIPSKYMVNSPSWNIWIKHLAAPSAH